MEVILFYIFAALTLAGAIGVAVSRNIVRAAVQLLFSLLGVGALYFLLSAEFLAAVQLVIYVGGTLVLITFAVMLTARGGSQTLHPSWPERLAAMVSAAMLVTVLVISIVQADFAEKAHVESAYPVRALGQELLGDYLLAFELISLLLLAVMIGAAYLAKRRSHEKGPT